MKIKVVSGEKETPNGGNNNQNAAEYAKAMPPRTFGYGCHLLMTSAPHTVLPAPAGIPFAASGTADAKQGIPAGAGRTVLAKAGCSQMTAEPTFGALLPQGGRWTPATLTRPWGELEHV